MLGARDAVRSAAPLAPSSGLWGAPTTLNPRQGKNNVARSARFARKLALVALRPPPRWEILAELN
eukprot:15465774-Alexandrium_andersonii.AAC.1